MGQGNGKTTATIPEAEIPDADILEAAAPERAKLSLQAIKREEFMGMDMLTFASAAVNSGFFPTVESASQAVIKVLIGRDLGVSPTAALRHIYVHKGHIGIQSELMAARIKESGHYDYKIIRADETVCELQFLQLLRGEWAPLGPNISFTMDEAKRAKLIKADSAWESYPADLLFARAISRGTRRYVPHIWKGQTVYTPEEAKAAAGDVVETTARTVLVPEGLTAEQIKDAAVRGQNDAPPGSTAPATLERQAPTPEPPAAGAPVQQDLAKF